MATAAVVTAVYEDTVGIVKVITVTWSSSDLGAWTITTPKYNGFLIHAVTDPSATAPTDNYDIVITDSDGADVLGSCAVDLMNRDTANTERVDFYVTTGLAHPGFSSKLTITGSDCGDDKDGVLRLYWKQG